MRAWWTIIGSRRPRVRLRLRVIRLCYRAISRTIRRLSRIWPRIWLIHIRRRNRAICRPVVWLHSIRLIRIRRRNRAVRRPVVWLHSIWLIRIRRRNRTVRRPVVWLRGVRLRHRPTLSRSISRLFVIRRAWPIRWIILRLPLLRLPWLTWAIRNVALSTLSRGSIYWLGRLWSFSHRYRRLPRGWSNLNRRGLSLCRRRRLDLSNLRNRKWLATVALYCFLASFKRRWRWRRRRLGNNRALLESRRRLMFRGSCRS